MAGLALSRGTGIDENKLTSLMWVNLLMFPYLLIIPERFNFSLARSAAGAAEEPRQTAIRPILQEGAA